MAITKDDLYSSKIFLNAALPLAKVIAMDIPKLGDKFKKTHAVIQVSALDPDSPEGKVGTHFVINSGEWLVHAGRLTRNPHIELEFQSIPALNKFFKGQMGPDCIPKFHLKVKYVPDLISFVMVLLKMSKLLGATEAPEDEETKKLMVKCFFYLVTSGISQLNKAGHEEIHQWALQSPDRVYSIGVDGHPDVSAYIRIKAGNSKAGRGTYKRSLPFFNMRFPTYDDALGILLGTADMLDSLKAGKLILDGAPEFAGQIGNFMFAVADYAKG